MPSGLLIAILAAGASRRLGQPKQLVMVGDEPLLRRQCRIAADAKIGRVVAILGCQADLCTSVLTELSVGIRRNESWQEGIAASIREATRHACEYDCAGLLLLHCDQYLVNVKDLQALHVAWEQSGGTAICRAQYQDYFGPPVIFPAKYFPHLQLLQGDEGARAILAALGPHQLLDVELANAVTDLDCPAQLAFLILQ